MLTAVVCVGECSRESKRRREEARRNGDTYLLRMPKQDKKVIARRTKLRMHGVPEDLVQIHGLRPDLPCEACGRITKVDPDHDHKHCPGKYGCSVCFRGFLCRDCNASAGNSHDSPQTLRLIAEYLERKN